MTFLQKKISFSLFCKSNGIYRAVDTASKKVKINKSLMKSFVATGSSFDMVEDMTIALVIDCLGLLTGQKKLLFCLFCINELRMQPTEEFPKKKKATLFFLE